MPRVLVESAVKAALHERHAATIEADAPAGPVARNGIKPAAETKRTWHSSHVRNLGIRHTDNDAFELWMPRADAAGIAVEHRNRPPVRRGCRRVQYFEVRNSLNDRAAAVPAVDSRVVEQVIHHGNPLRVCNYWNPARAVGSAASRDNDGQGRRDK